ncbi:MAG TPA: ATP-grasp domain-containing protein [Bacteroidota bacterium]|nr:ATP-grasp domain-containing protein [Bacteroidota bacterium]
MNKKIHVCIVYNEPLNGWGIKRQYVSENGVLQIGGPGTSGGPVEVVDLSEVGVLGEMEDISRALQSQGYKPSIFNVNADIVRFVRHLHESRPDVIFNLCESVGNESIHEMHAVGIFELMGIPYTGSEPLVLGTALNKVRVKEMLLYHGLNTPRYQLIDSPLKFTVDPSLTFPLIVKPAHEDASIGIDSKSIVRSIAELKRKVRHIYEQFDQAALVEEYIDGRELNVGILGNKKPTVFPISEIDMSTLPKQYPRIISYNAKWLKGSDEYEHTKGVCPADLPADVAANVREMALAAYTLVGCRDYTRVDFRLSPENVPYILEVNPNPDISDDAGFARAGKAYGYSFEQLIGRIVECALERIS